MVLATAMSSDVPVYVWEDPGNLITVHLSLEVIERLGSAVTAALQSNSERGLEVGGILLGKTEPGETRSITITDFEPMASEHLRGPSYSLSRKDKQLLEQKLRRGRWKKNLTVVGYYRSHSRPGLYLDQDDFSVISSYFQDPRQVVLLIKPSAGETSVAGFFFWEDGDINRKAPYLQFPFDRKQLLAEDFRILNRPLAGDRPVVRRVKPRWIWAPLAMMLVLIAGVFGVWRLLQLRTPRQTGRQALSLNVERSGNTLRLIWDRHSPAVQNAGWGVLSITDGDRRERLDLDPKQLAAGSMTYSPTQGDVNFQLEVFVIARRVSESVRTFVPVIRAPQLKPTPLAISEPPAAVPQSRIIASKQPVTGKPAAPAIKPYAERLESAGGSADRMVADEELEPPPVLSPSPPAITAPRLPPNRKTYQEAAVAYEPVQPSTFIRKIPGLRALARHRTEEREGFVPARPVHRVAPIMLGSFNRERAPETPVDLKVYIDESGKVARTKLLSKETDQELARLAVNAARQWEFVPARQDEKVVSSEMILHFTFGGGRESQ